MNLPNDLLSQFVKITNDSKKTNSESTVYGTIVYDDRIYVRIDGSDMLTPVSTIDDAGDGSDKLIPTSTTAVEDGDRVEVTIKDHTAVVTGNLTSPAVRTGTVDDLTDEVTQFENVMAYKVTAEDIRAVEGLFNNLYSTTVTIGGLTAEDVKAIRTSRFIAYQAFILYTKDHKIAIVIKKNPKK